MPTLVKWLPIAAAACQPFEYVTVHGVGVYGDQVVEQDQVEAATAAILELVPGKNSKIRDWLDGSTLRFRGSAVNGELAGKVVWANDQIVIQSDPCLYRTAFAHEMTHVVEYLRTGDSDHTHGDPEYWKAPCMEDANPCYYTALETRANRAIADLCDG